VTRSPGTDLLVGKQDPENEILSPSAWAAERDAAEREKHQLMQAAIDEMCLHPDKSPRVSDIVARAGLSNNAFYRHFRSKDDLVVAILDDGRRALLGYLEHLMAGEPTGTRKVRRWIEGMMAQAVDPGAAAATRAVHLNARRVDDGAGDQGFRAEADLRALLQIALRGANSGDPARDAYVIFQAVASCMTDFLVREVEPTPADVEHLASFCVAGIAGVSRGT